MPSPSERSVLAIDIGGTKIAASIVDRHGTRKAFHQFETPTVAEPAKWIAAVSSGLGRFVAQSGHGKSIAGIFFSTVGPQVERDGHIHINPPNIPALQQGDGVPYPELIANRLGLPFDFDNDAHTALAAELLDPRGALAGLSTAAQLLWSSGIGGGIFHNGRMVHFEPRDRETWARPLESKAGRNSFEPGHEVADSSPDAPICGDGGRGHLEAYLGGKPAENRGEDPRRIHGELMADGARLLPIVLGPYFADYGVRKVAVAGSIGRALLAHDGYAAKLSEAFKDVGVQVKFVAAAFDNASLRGAELLGAGALKQRVFDSHHQFLRGASAATSLTLGTDIGPAFP